MDTTPHKTIVPEPEIFAAPACKQCGVTFRHAGGSWRQACNCPAKSGIWENGRLWASTYSPNIELIGQPKGHWCILCPKQLATGEEAMLGQMGVYGYVGYAHIACYEADQRRAAQASAEAQAAAAGVQITCWYGPEAEVQPAPTTGHYDGEARSIPAEAPALPDGAVVYDEYRRPVAKIRIAFPDRAAAEAWWQAATRQAGAAYELYWFEPGVERATRDWRGRGFSAVQSRARIAERLSEPEVR